MEEIDSPAEGTMNSFSYKGRKCEAKLLCDILHCESAKALAFYDEDFYRGMPTLTVNDYGQGKAYYVTTSQMISFMKPLSTMFAAKQGRKELWRHLTESRHH